MSTTPATHAATRRVRPAPVSKCSTGAARARPGRLAASLPAAPVWVEALEPRVLLSAASFVELLLQAQVATSTILFVPGEGIRSLAALARAGTPMASKPSKPKAVLDAATPSLQEAGLSDAGSLDGEGDVLLAESTSSDVLDLTVKRGQLGNRAAAGGEAHLAAVVNIAIGGRPYDVILDVDAPGATSIRYTVSGGQSGTISGSTGTITYISNGPSVVAELYPSYPDATVGGPNTVTVAAQAEGLNGAFELAHALHQRGYDAHMYRETDVENDPIDIANPGTGPAYDEVKAAVEHRAIIQAASSAIATAAARRSC